MGVEVPEIQSQKFFTGLMKTGCQVQKENPLILNLKEKVTLELTALRQ